MSVLDDEFQFGLQTVLEYPYMNAKNREIGSIAISLFCSDTGEPSSQWRPVPIYAPTRTDVDGRALMTGFVEATAGRSIGIILTWRSKKGTLTKSWKLQDDLLAYYYIDGRPKPVMEYSIIQPGAKNPLPLSGLWPEETVRWPMKWKMRPSVKPGKISHRPQEEPGMFQPRLMSGIDTSTARPSLMHVDDLSSFRVTMHLRVSEEEAREMKTTTKMAANIARPKQAHEKYTHERLTHYVELDHPTSIDSSIARSMLTDAASPPRTLPFLEYRLYYKSRQLLQDLGYLPIPHVHESALIDHPPEVDATPSTAYKQTAILQGAQQLASAELEIPKAPPAVVPAKRTASQRIDAESSSPCRVKMEDVKPDADELPSPSVMQSASQDASQSNRSTPRTVPASDQLRRTVLNGNTSVSTSIVASPASSVSSSGASSAHREAAMQFLLELGYDEEDAEENEMIAVGLLESGFKTKKRFLSNLERMDEIDRQQFLTELRNKLGPSDFSVFKSYIRRTTGIEYTATR